MINTHFSSMVQNDSDSHTAWMVFKYNLSTKNISICYKNINLCMSSLICCFNNAIEPQVIQVTIILILMWPVCCVTLYNAMKQQAIQDMKSQMSHRPQTLKIQNLRVQPKFVWKVCPNPHFASSHLAKCK